MDREWTVGEEQIDGSVAARRSNGGRRFGRERKPSPQKGSAETDKSTGGLATLA